MNYSFGKEEKLKSKIEIENLFKNGKFIKNYPLNLVFSETKLPSNVFMQVGVSASKKYFKHAVDRNRVKRLLREAYRLNKHLLVNNNKTYAVMIFYTQKTLPEYELIEEKMIQILTKLNNKIQ